MTELLLPLRRCTRKCPDSQKIFFICRIYIKSVYLCRRAHSRERDPPPQIIVNCIPKPTTIFIKSKPVYLCRHANKAALKSPNTKNCVDTIHVTGIRIARTKNCKL